MFKNRRITELERENWIRAKKKGRRQFILRRGLLPTLLIWLAVSLLVGFFQRRDSSSPWQVLITAPILLPICLLAGYLDGVWTWKDMENKYPE
jgi:hypothetical protein